MSACLSLTNKPGFQLQEEGSGLPEIPQENQGNPGPPDSKAGGTAGRLSRGSPAPGSVRICPRRPLPPPHPPPPAQAELRAGGGLAHV